MSASVEERHAAHVAICLARIGAWRGNAGKSDRVLLLPIVIAAIVGKLAYARVPIRNLVAQPRVAARDLFRCVRLALRAYLAEVRHPAAWQLGCRSAGSRGGRTPVITPQLITSVSAARWCIHSSAVSPDLPMESIPRYGATVCAVESRA